MPLPPLAQLPTDLVAACDYERYARERMAEATWAYVSGGVGDEHTLSANPAAWQQLPLHTRVLADLKEGHTRTVLFGQSMAHPILLAPVAYQTLLHPEGERASAYAAGAMGAGFVASTLSGVPLEAIAAATTGPLWFQLYFQPDRAVTADLVRRAEAAGYQVLVVTVDVPVNGVRNRERRAGFSLPPAVQAANLEPYPLPAPPVLSDWESPVFQHLMAQAPTWRDIEWLQAQTRLPIVLKGITSVTDAREAANRQLAGVVVSNHGGRSLDTLPATARLLPDIAEAVGTRMTVLVDGGIRRGTDVLKALALGADAVMVGRPQAHALATAGALGVAHLLKLLHEELEMAMALTGCATVEAVGPQVLAHR